MKRIQIELSPEQAHNVLILIDLAMKHKNGGVKVARLAMEIVDLINQAVATQKDATPVPVAGQ